ncbi:hypothetical protein ADUPG1_009181, partial [Aduncisulcus paluster]
MSQSSPTCYIKTISKTPIPLHSIAPADTEALARHILLHGDGSKQPEYTQTESSSFSSDITQSSNHHSVSSSSSSSSNFSIPRSYFKSLHSPPLFSHFLRDLQFKFDGTVRRRGISMVYHDTVEVNVFIWYKTEKVGEICSDILIPPPPCVCPILTKDVEEEEDEDEDDDDEEEEEEDREDAEVGGKDEEEEGNRHGIIDSETEFYAKHKSAGERWFDVTKIPL